MPSDNPNSSTETEQQLNAGRYRKAAYVNSVHNLPQLPADEGFEVAFAGRSNAGKSTCINRLCGQTALAKTSRTPGRTQQIVVFELDEQRRIMDLPGYGYAKVPAKLQQHWQQVLDSYLSNRKCLAGVVLVMDSRHPLKPFDLQMLDWLSASELEGHVLLTKADKLKRQEQVNALRKVKTHLQQQRMDSLITAQLFSALKHTGISELEARLDEWYQWLTV